MSNRSSGSRSASTKLRIGFVGLGAMGAPMSENLLAAGHVVRGFDLREEALTRFEEKGGLRAASVAETADGADILMLMVVNAAQAESVLFEAGGLDALDPQGVVVLHATCMKTEVEAIAARVAGTGRGFVDAPVSGGIAGATTGSLTIMMSGAIEAVEKARPALDVVGERVFVVGERPGQGAVAKTVNQLLCGVHIAAAAEAFSLAERLGLDMDAMLEIVSGSAASSWMLKDRGPRMLGDSDAVASAIDIFCKDLGIVMDTGRNAGAALPLAAAALQMFLASSGRGEGRLDDSQVIQSYRKLAGG